MSFASGQIVGAAENIDLHLMPQHDREERVLKIVKAAAEEIAREVGGYVAVSVNGHVNDYEGGVGDSINVQINSLLPPPAPVKDAGLEAAGGSPRNFPPEASTAAPATEDNSPPAAQGSVPQSADAVPPTPASHEQPDADEAEVYDLVDAGTGAVIATAEEMAASGSDSTEPEQSAAE